MRHVWKAVVVIAIAAAVVLVVLVKQANHSSPPTASQPVSSSPSAPMAAASAPASQPASAPAVQAHGNSPTMVETYPQLASAGLAHARLADLPKGTLLRAGDVAITQKDIDAQIAQAPPEVRDQLRKNAFFLLEQMATRRVLLAEAGRNPGGAGLDERALVQSYLAKLVEGAQVSDQEIAEFYQANRETVGNATLEQVKPQIREYLLGEKQQQIVDRHIQTMGQRTAIEVSSAWVKKQAELAKDNPVDKARASGKPTFANFGAKGCVPCDMMEPIREALRKKHEGKLNVVFIHVQNDPVLASRYGVQAIPLLVFFDAEGKEVFRHMGFFPQEKIEGKLAEMGVK